MNHAVRISLVIALVIGSARTAGADEPTPVVLSLEPPSSTPLFNREIPSGVDIKLQIEVPGKDAVAGRVSVWHPRTQDCKEPTGGKQSHELAMTVDGTEDARKLQSVIPALQSDTAFCFKVTIRRGLDETRTSVIAAKVAHDIAIPLDTACSDPRVLRTKLVAEVSRALDAALNDERAVLRTRSARAGLGIAPTDQQRAARVAVDRMAVEADCATVTKAVADKRTAIEGAKQAQTDLAAKQAAVKALSGLVSAAPPLYAAVDETGKLTVQRLRPLVDADDAMLAKIATAVDPIEPALAQKLRDIIGAADADKPAKRTALRAALDHLPARAPTLYLWEPPLQATGTGQITRIAAADIAKLLAPPYGADAALTTNAQFLLDQLIALDADTGAAGQAKLRVWRDTIRSLVAASQTHDGAITANKTADTALDTARAQFATDVETTLKTDTVRAYLRDIVTVTSPWTPTAHNTEGGVSYVSADIGVLAALPYYDDGSQTPWLVPYAGVNIYFMPVDRIIDVRDLVDHEVRQRMSLTVGALITRPKVHDAEISTPFLDSGIVPVAALGWRVTSFTKLALGGMLFDYRQANPATRDTRLGAALWFGASIDADVWSAVAGKAFK